MATAELMESLGTMPFADAFSGGLLLPGTLDPNFEDALRHVLDNPGSLVRPRLVFQMATAYGMKTAHAQDLAVAGHSRKTPTRDPKQLIRIPHWRRSMKPTVHSLVISLPLFFTPLAFAQQQTFAVAPESSQVAFALAGTGHHVNGTFHVQSGVVDFDRAAQKISGSVVVAAGSGNSGEPSRDKKMNTDVLDVAHFAEIAFAPKSYHGTITASGDSTIQVTGAFTLHGASHDLTAPMQIHIDGTGLTAKTHFTVPYVQWGLKDPSVFILKVAKEVDIDLTLAGKVTP